jgi:hypothetical protein
MAKPKKDEDGGAVVPKDFDKASKIYLHDIKPARSRASEFMQEISTAFKAVKKTCGIQPSAMKAAIKSAEMEDAKRDDWLRCFVGIVNKMAGRNLLTFHGSDLVDMAQGAEVVPIAGRRSPMATLPSDGVDADLAEAGGAEVKPDPFVATEDEIAKQDGRGKPRSKAN